MCSQRPHQPLNEDWAYVCALGTDMGSHCVLQVCLCNGACGEESSVFFMTGSVCVFGASDFLREGQIATEEKNKQG